MSFGGFNLWIEGDISTNRILSRLLNDLGNDKRCNTRLISTIDAMSLSGGGNIFCRVCSPVYAWLPRFLIKHGIEYAYFIDDNFWDLRGDSDLARYYQSPSVISSLDEFVRNAKIVISNSEYLYNFLGVRFPTIRRVLLTPPFDTNLTKDWVFNESQGSASVAPVIGYAGGYKPAEFKFLTEVIDALTEKRPDVRFELIGGSTPKLREHPSVQWFPGQSDYAEFMAFKLSRHWTIGLSPLFFSAFNSSKTNNKFREYGGCGIPGIYSNETPYCECVQNGATGLLVENNVDSWVSAIENLIDTPVLREKIKRGAFQYIDNTYSHQAVSAEWIYALEGLSGSVKVAFADRLRFCYLKKFNIEGKPESAQAILDSSDFAVYGKRVREALSRSFSSLYFKTIIGLFLFLTLLNVNLFLIGLFNQ